MSAKILVVDIETAPMEVRVWGIGQQFITPDRIVKDWSVLSWCAKWLDKPEIIYRDQRNAKDIRDDKELLKPLWKLLDEADVVIWQNGKKFDHPKLNARFIQNKMKPPSTYKQFDTCEAARKHFGFSSNKLEYLTDKLCTKYKKLKHKKFPGNELWDECLAGNVEAWREMEKYNKHDVLALEELYTKLAPWGRPVNFDLYTEGEENVCSCGSTEFYKNGFYYTQMGKFQRYLCKKCNSETHSSKNLLTPEKKASIRKNSQRSA